MRPTGSAEELERRRRRALALRKEGYTQTQIAELLGCCQSSVSIWEKMASQGNKGLRAKPHPGRPRLLTDQEHRELEKLLVQGAEAHGWPNDLWTSQRVKELILQRFGVDYHVDHVRKILVYRLGWTSQKPEKRARERDEGAIDRWHKEDFPRLKKTPEDEARRSYS